MKTTASNLTLIAALNNVNKTQGYSLSFNRFEKIGKYYHFTLKSPSKVPGSRTSISGKNLACASWHAHGYLFDEIFKIEPEAIIYTIGKKITSESGNWVDQNLGRGYMYSQTSIL
jgi:hypothetical protein